MLTTLSRWVLVGVGGAVLLVPQIAGAQQPGRARNAGKAAPRASAPASDDVPAAPRSPGAGGGAAIDTYEAPPAIRTGETLSVLVFPFGVGAERDTKLSQTQQELADHVTAAVKAGLLSSPAFAVVSFHPNAALVQKALKDQYIRQSHLTGVTTSNGAVNLVAARELAKRLGLQAVMFGNVEVNRGTGNSVEVTLDGAVVGSVGGEVIRQGAVSGAAAGAQGVAIEAVQERAAGDAASKLLAALGIELVVPAPNAAAAASGGRGKSAGGRARSSNSSGETRAAREARASADKAAAEARKAARDAARDAERAARDRKKQDARPSQPRSEAVPATAPSQRQTAAPAPLAPVEVAAANITVAKDEATVIAQSVIGGAAQAAPRTATVKGTANAAGQAVPYGYAIGEVRNLPQRERKSLKVPPWIGVAAFVTGISFLF